MKNKSSTPKRDIHQEVTDKIVAMLETLPDDGFQTPFATLAAQGMPINPITNQGYHGINALNLWVSQRILGFQTAQWATFKQWKQKDAFVKKNQKGTTIIFYKSRIIKEQNEAGETEEKSMPILRSFTVFNADQVEGIDHSEGPNIPNSNLVSPISAAERYFANTKADIRHSGDQAYFSPSGDYINMPESALFIDTDNASATEGYYSVLGHEIIHWSGSKKRLNRPQLSTKIDKEAYAFEELIAELGASFLCAGLGITQAPREDHAHYIKSWLKTLKNNKKLIFSAAAEASKAVEYLDSLQHRSNTETAT